ncbi:MAG: M23 family metallopeptidase [Bacteroidales bacterium]|nr:M23 family metallopeptidase [Bacteroidales bacterium]
MSPTRQKQTFWQKYRNKYRLSILNDTTFEEVFRIRLSRMNIISVLSVSGLIFAAFIFALVAYTPIREFIPGYPDGETNANIIKNVYRLDSVENTIRLNQQYIDNIKRIFQGKSPKNYGEDNATDSITVKKDTISLTISEKDSLFRVRMEQENEFDFLAANFEVSDDMSLFPPIKGLVSNNYNPKKKHFGIDIVGKSNQDVFACFKGTVINTSWSMQTGYTVQVQHPNNLISTYKHLQSVNVEQGQKISTGKLIGKIGDVGTLSTGPHLHFELWKDGQPVKPDELINFN